MSVKKESIRVTLCTSVSVRAILFGESDAFFRSQYNFKILCLELNSLGVNDLMEDGTNTRRSINLGSSYH